MCQVGYRFGPWGSWSPCSKTCGVGETKRSRKCLGKRSQCVGESEQRKTCNTKICKSEDNPLQCGKINEKLVVTPRILGGRSAYDAKWPWHVGVYKSKWQRVPHCGGTLLSPNIVVSAAHCFKSRESTHYVRVGDFDLTKRGKYEEVIPVSKILRHSKFDVRTYRNDIAILVLSKKVTLRKEINAACLPGEIEEYSKCYATGWGRLGERGGVPKQLQEAPVPLVDYITCQKSYRRLLYPGMICAGYKYGGADTCTGDSGGPLVCEKPNGRYALVGITSFGYGCGKAGFYGVYTEVTNHIKEIKYTIKKYKNHPS